MGLSGVVAVGVRAAGHPVVLVFLLAGIFDVLSGQPLVQAGILFGVAVALVWDAVARWRARQSAAETSEPGGGAPWPVAWPRPSGKLVLAGAAYALVAGTFHPATWPATVAVAVPGAVGFAAAWRRLVPVAPVRPGPRLHSGWVGAWAAVFVALGVWELVALLGQPALDVMSPDSPTISFLMEPVLASYAGRSLTLSAWLAAGWWLLRR